MDYSVVGYAGVSSWVKALDREELDKEKDACGRNHRRLEGVSRGGVTSSWALC
jgi:hypothetical protein